MRPIARRFRLLHFGLSRPIFPLRRTFSSASSAANLNPISVSEEAQEPSVHHLQEQHKPPPTQPPHNPPASRSKQKQKQPQSLIYPNPPSSLNHTSLPTFLDYASRTNLDPSSTVYVGTHFEYTVAGALARLGLDLRRVGGISDCGIDLLGTWTLPFPPPASSSSSGKSLRSRPRPFLRVIAQCKAVQRPGPHLVRELEGAFAGAPAGWRAWKSPDGGDENGAGRGVLGLLVTQRPATKGIREALARSRWPMGFVACSREGEVSQLLWNRRAEEEGLEGFGVGVSNYHTEDMFRTRFDLGLRELNHSNGASR
ncbi:hypothetical protein VTJ04DRAFT_4510 [Mycothermus thermophilus]|uniref:uncharacterized protein n=1 Tax=Humicola insolens TaxID=85995 RepID=UPI0037444C68